VIAVSSINQQIAPSLDIVFDNVVFQTVMVVDLVASSQAEIVLSSTLNGLLIADAFLVSGPVVVEGSTTTATPLITTTAEQTSTAVYEDVSRLILDSDVDFVTFLPSPSDWIAKRIPTGFHGKNYYKVHT
jgi:hypothetical protein